jgi:magnesium transporter
MKNRKQGKKRAGLVVRQHVSPGALPGTFYVEPGAAPPEIRVIAYGAQEYAETTIREVSEIRPLLDKWPVVWVDVEGFGDGSTLRALSEMFDIHLLALEDVVLDQSRPKAELYGDRVFFITRMAQVRQDLETEQVSFFLGRQFVLTFQQGAPGDSFDRVRHHIRANAGTLRTSGADYLCYSLIDAIVDQYFPVLEQLGDRLEALETEALSRPSLDTVSRVHLIKSHLLAVRRIVWPMREALQTVLREQESVFKAETRVYLRDCQDNLLQIMDLVESYRELAASLTDLYLSSSSNRMNEVMKVLTIIATIFMPLSFLASLYGMNFDTEASPWNMPELKTRFGYPALLVVMAIIAVGMVLAFWHSGWFRPTLPPARPADKDDTGNGGAA